MTIKFRFASIGSTLVLSLMTCATVYAQVDVHSRARISTNMQQRSRHQVQGSHHNRHERDLALVNRHNDEITDVKTQDAQIEARRHDDEQNYRTHLNTGNVHTY